MRVQARAREFPTPPRTPVAAALLAAALLGAGRMPLAAQDSASATAGSRVRVAVAFMSPESLTGRIQRLTADSMHLRYRADAPALPIARDRITRLEVSRGRPGLRRRLVVGTTLGLLAGGLMGWTVFGPGECADCIGKQTSEHIKSGLFFGTIGAAVGAMVGSIGVRERWAPGHLADAATRRASGGFDAP